MIGAAGTAAGHVYVYGVARTGCNALPPLAGGGVVPGRPVEVLPIGKLAAVVSILQGPILREAGLSEAEWAKSRAVAHHQVLAALTHFFPLAPFKFGTVLRSRDDLVDLMKRNAAALEKTLDHIAGCHEWGLKLFADLSILREVARSDPALAPIQEELACAPAGKAYFIRKKLRLAVEAEAERMLAVRAIEVHRRLTSASRESAPVRSSHGPKPAKSGIAPVMLLNAAYLVEESGEAAFHEALAAMRGSFAESGLSDELTGPWPPYNFVPLSAGGRDHV